MSDASAMSARFAGAFGGFRLDATFEAPMRGVTALFGPSGSGKTTILRCMAGLARLPGRFVVAGEVWQDDATGVFRAPHERPIGFVFQEASLFAHLSVRRNLVFGLKRAAPGGAARIGFDDVVRLLGIGPLLDRGVSALSGGERQRVAIGRALLSQPRLLLMDEPLSALDQMTRQDILPYFEALADALAIPIVYVSHDLAEVQRLAQHLVLIDKGRVATSAPIADALADLDTPLARGATASVILEARVTRIDDAYDVTFLDLEGESIVSPGRAGAPGDMRRIRVAANDVSIAVERPSRTSISNILAARIIGIEAVDAAQANVLLSIGHRDGGARLIARITRRAADGLGLAAGQDVYAQVKAAPLIASRAGLRAP